MKLFVWNSPYPVKYGQSLLMVVADTIEDALEQAPRGRFFNCGLLDQDVAPEHMKALTALLGDPSRVVELPCAEWHEWVE